MRYFIQFRYLLARYIWILGTIRSLSIEPQRAARGATPLLEINKGKLKTDNREFLGRWGATLILTILQSGQVSCITVILFYTQDQQYRLNDLTL